MKKSLKEQIERIHTLTYGKKVSKGDFLENLLSEQVVTKVDDPKKADLVGTDTSGKQLADDKLVEDFYKTLEKAISDGGLTQQKSGSYSYQKEVESMQVALELVGYDLPRFGIDGLFGPETSAAVIKFAKDNNIDLSKNTQITEDAAELRSTLSDLGYEEKGSEIANGGPITDELSSTVSKVLRDFKTSNPDVKVRATGGNDKFHKGLNYNSKHKEGKALDVVIEPYNSKNAKAFLSILDKYKSSDSNFTYIDEYNNPSGAATGGHFHLQYGKGSATGGSSLAPEINGTVATPELLRKLVDSVKVKNISPQELKDFMDKNVIRSGGGGGVIDVKDWQGVINTIIDNLEGGYYHPDMLSDGRVRDSRYGNSGETMFGIDRKMGPESKTPKGLEFWALIDAQDARNKWQNEQGFGKRKIDPALDAKLRSLVAEMIKPFFDQYTRRYLTPEAANIVSQSPALTFHFAYAVFNGSGHFQKFARVINGAVANGNTDPKSLLELAMDDRMAATNSLMKQVAPKVKAITDKISMMSA